MTVADGFLHCLDDVARCRNVYIAQVKRVDLVTLCGPVASGGRNSEGRLGSEFFQLLG